MEISIEHYNKMVEHLTELEYLLAEQRWIPCSERLPEFDFMDVLVCFHDKRSGCKKDYYFISAYIVHGVWEPTLHADLTDLEAVAWMPLPEPYRKGEQDE